MIRFFRFFLICILITGCAARDDDGNIMYDENGEEQTDGLKTAGLIFGALAVVATGIVIAKHSNENYGGGGNSGYSGNCECPNDKDSRGDFCGERSALIRPNGYAPSREYCLNKDYNFNRPLKYRY